MDTSTQMQLGRDSSFLQQLGTDKATHRERLVTKIFTDMHLQEKTRFPLPALQKTWSPFWHNPAPNGEAIKGILAETS